MNPILNKQDCLNCHHAELYHNPESNGMDIIRCMAWSVDSGQLSSAVSGMNTTLTSCKCNEFRMDNLKYMEQLYENTK